jgi:hypothetical protein
MRACGDELVSHAGCVPRQSLGTRVLSSQHTPFSAALCFLIISDRAGFAGGEDLEGRALRPIFLVFIHPESTIGASDILLLFGFAGV